MSKQDCPIAKCSAYQGMLLNRLQLGSITKSTLSRKLKFANMALVSTISWIDTHNVDLKRPIVEICEAYRKTSNYYRDLGSIDQAVCMDLLRAVVYHRRENPDLLLRLGDVNSWPALADQLIAHGNAARAEWAKNKQES